MKIAFAGKGGAGNTAIVAWMADYLVRSGYNAWLIDAGTAHSLGVASGLDPGRMPVPLIERENIIESRIKEGAICLESGADELPAISAVLLPESRAALLPGAPRRGAKRLIVKGTSPSEKGCACRANTLLKDLLDRFVCNGNDYVLVDLESGIDHMGRGTIAGVDRLVIVSEPSVRSLNSAASLGKLGRKLGLNDQVLVLNRCPNESISLPFSPDIPHMVVGIPDFSGLKEKMLQSGSVLDIPEQKDVDGCMEELFLKLKSPEEQFKTPFPGAFANTA